MFRRIKKSRSETETRWGGDRSLDKQTINWAFPSLHLAFLWIYFLPFLPSCESTFMLQRGKNLPPVKTKQTINWAFLSLPAFLWINLRQSVTKSQKSARAVQTKQIINLTLIHSWQLQFSWNDLRWSWSKQPEIKITIHSTCFWSLSVGDITQQIQKLQHQSFQREGRPYVPLVVFQKNIKLQ